MRSYMLMLRDTTEVLYSRAYERGQRGIFWSALTGRSRCLLALEEARQWVDVSSTQQCQRGDQTHMAPISQIRGSEGRGNDFDRDFNPLQDHNRGRWLRIAAARQRGVSLPPVELVQVGDLYFVRDGHHRISVACALGQPSIEARVTVWHLSGSLPWEMQTQASQPAGQKTLVGRLYNEIATFIRMLWSDQTDKAMHAGFSTYS